MSKLAPALDSSVQHTVPEGAAGEDVAAPGTVRQAAGSLFHAIGSAVIDATGRAKVTLGETVKAKREDATDAAVHLEHRAGQMAGQIRQRTASAVRQTVDAASTAIDGARGTEHPAAAGTPAVVGVARTGFTAAEARRVGEQIGIDWAAAPFDVEQFRIGMGVELEHGFQDTSTNVTNDDPTFTGKIALAHLNEFADYYTRLERMEAAARREDAGGPGAAPPRQAQ